MMGNNRNHIKKKEGKVKEMVKIDNVVTPNSEQMDFMIGAMMDAYEVEDRAESKVGWVVQND